MRDVVAVVLAGGLGTRLRPVLADRPKVLAEISGRPFLTYVLDQLAEVQIKRVVLCVGYLGEQVYKLLGGSYRDLELLYSHESSPLDTAGALRLALPFLSSDPVLVMNGDSLFRSDLNEFWHWHRTRAAAGTLLLTRVAETDRYGRVEIEDDGRVLRFEEKAARKGPGSVNTGIYLLSRRLLSSIPTSGPVSLEKEIFPQWIGRGLFGYRTKGRFLDIGTPESFSAADRFLAEDRSREAGSPSMEGTEKL